VQSAVIQEQMSLPFDVLAGRVTFDIWVAYWPEHPDTWSEVQTATNFVASNTLEAHAWGPSRFLSGDVAGQVAELKQQPGPDLHVYGSANLLQALLAHDLVDALWLRIHPITLGGPARAAHSARYFKTGPGGYGEGGRSSSSSRSTAAAATSCASAATAHASSTRVA